MPHRVALLVAVAQLCSVTFPIAAVPVKLTCRDCPATGVEVSLVVAPAARAAEDDEDRTAERRFLAMVPGSIGLDVAPGSWILRVEGDDVWAAPVEVVIGGDEPPIATTVPVFRAGWVTAPSAQEGEAGALDIRLSFGSPAATPREHRLAGATACRVAHREFQCKLPAGIHDLSLEADGFAPIHRFDVAVAAGARVRLERVRWIRGASVHGWVLGPDGAPIAGAEVALLPFAGTASASPEAVRRSRRGRVADTTDARGFFQIAGLTPARYYAEAKAASFARLWLVDPLEVIADDALELELELAAPMSWTVHVTPTLGPGLEPWAVSLRRLDEPPGEASPDVRGTASPSGSWTWDEAEPGRLYIGAAGGAGQVFHETEPSNRDRSGTREPPAAPLAVARGGEDVPEAGRSFRPRGFEPECRSTPRPLRRCRGVSECL